MLEEIKNSVDRLRLALGSHDAAWFSNAFGPCERLLLAMSRSDRIDQPSPQRIEVLSSDRPGPAAALTISTVVLKLADRMRTGVFQAADGAPIKDAAAEFIERSYFDVLKPIFSAYPELTPHELST